MKKLFQAEGPERATSSKRKPRSLFQAEPAEGGVVNDAVVDRVLLT